ncbi:Zinc finger protein 91 [Plakobranchus ocellatus]|uniref:Zinc finger protein 91 n=1 Tax=Plakobranchus ocellatus TaxID=259542 RepID=A0AAV4DYV1_9GAST|nr:Zinc finger protein 91 [Plakobranchus ocellatus]
MPPYNFECFVCSESFPDADTLGVHVESHSIVKSFRCGICDAKFHDTLVLITHITDVHGALPSLYKCTICKETFQMLSSLREHVHHCQRNAGCVSKDHESAPNVDEMIKRECNEDLSDDDIDDDIRVHFGENHNEICGTAKNVGDPGHSNKVDNNTSSCHHDRNLSVQTIENRAISVFQPGGMEQMQNMENDLPKSYENRDRHNAENMFLHVDRTLGKHKVHSSTTEQCMTFQPLLTKQTKSCDDLPAAFQETDLTVNPPIRIKTYDGIKHIGQNLAKAHEYDTISGRQMTNKDDQDTIGPPKKKQKKSEDSCIMMDSSGTRNITVAMQKLEEDEIPLNLTRSRLHSILSNGPTDNEKSICPPQSSRLHSILSDEPTEDEKSICALKSVHQPLTRQSAGIYALRKKSNQLNLISANESSQDLVHPSFQDQGSINNQDTGTVLNLSLSDKYQQQNETLDSKQGSLLCKICSDSGSFSNVKELKKHMSCHFSEDCFTIQCVKCKVCSDSVYSLDKHLKVSDCLGFSCSICHMSFSLESCLYKHHVKAHKRGETDMKCSACGKQFTDRQSWIRHEGIHAKSEPFVCKICGKRFSGLQQIQRSHLPTAHNVVMKYSDFKEKPQNNLQDEGSSLQDSKETCHTEESVACKMKNLKVMVERNVPKDLVIESKSISVHDLPLKLVKKTVSWDQSTEISGSTLLTNKHSSSNSLPLCKTDIIAAKKPTLLLPSNKDKEDDMLDDKETADDSLPNNKPANGKQPLFCAICSEVHNNLKELKKHISCHFSEDCISIQCVKCNAFSDNVQSLDQHLNVLGCSGFTCPICPVSFSLEASLLKHNVQVHKKGEVEMKCGECGKICPNHSSWSRHAATHAKSLPYVCKICGSRFRCLKQIQLTHLPTVHNVALRRNDNIKVISNLKPVMEDEKTNKSTSLKNVGPHVSVKSSASASQPKALPSSQKVFLDCELCGGKAPDQQALTIHKTYHFMDDKFSIQCSGCLETFTSMSELNSHVQLKQCSQYKCDLCNQLYPTQQSLVSHITQTHDQASESGRYECSACNETFDIYSAHVDHTLKHHITSELFQCKICNANFSSMMLLENHLSEIHKLLKNTEEQGKFQCAQCLGIFGSKNAIQTHRHFHRNRKQLKEDKDDISKPDNSFASYITSYFCQICSIGFSGVIHLERHKEIHGVASSELKCHVCKDVFTCKSRLNDHIKIHSKNFLCSECGKAFTTEHMLKTHKLVYHSNANPFYCKECNKYFSSKSCLQHHMKRHSGDLRFECALCGKKFISSNSLESHMVMHSVQTRYKCDICGYQCRHRTGLDRHRKIHSQDKEFNCPTCGKSFTQSFRMKIHLRRHSGEKKFMCELCGKNFSTRNYLKSHALLHSKEKPFACPLCSKTFAVDSNLNIHVKKVHGDTVYQQFKEQKKMQKLLEVYMSLKWPLLSSNQGGASASSTATDAPHPADAASTPALSRASPVYEPTSISESGDSDENINEDSDKE